MLMRAVVVGATGMVGKEVVHQLLEDEDYEHVMTLSRRKLPFHHDKLEQRIIDFNELDEIKSVLQGAALFCLLGTTIKKREHKKHSAKLIMIIRCNSGNWLTKQVPVHSSSLRRSEQMRSHAYFIVVLKGSWKKNNVESLLLAYTFFALLFYWGKEQSSALGRRLPLY